MGFVHNLDKVACCPPAQKSFNAVRQYFIAVYRHISCLLAYPVPLLGIRFEFRRLGHYGRFSGLSELGEVNVDDLAFFSGDWNRLIIECYFHTAGITD